MTTALTIAREIAENLNQLMMKAGEERCVLQLYTWHAAEEIKNDDQGRKLSPRSA